MDKWTWALILAIPFAITQTLIFGSGSMARMLGAGIGAVLVYALVWYGILSVGGWIFSLFRKKERAAKKIP